MKVKIKESPLFWPVKLKGNRMLVLDETLLPSRMHYIEVKNTKGAVKVIKDMRTRAFGQFLVVLNTFLLVIRGNKTLSQKELFSKLQDTAKKLNASRPTFPFSEVTGIVLRWAKKAIEENLDLRVFLEKNINGFLMGIRVKRLGRIQKIASVMKDNHIVLTHCNVSGELAMAAQICKKQNKRIHFFATETRPYFQGSKLTCWELKRMGADVTLIADNAVGSLLSDRFIDLVIVGSDRSCANGDIANKIGTYQIAVLAKEFGIPLYALTQPSSRIKRGADIPIELRDANEMLIYRGKRIAPRGVKGFYPGFDVIPKGLITKAIELNVN